MAESAAPPADGGIEEEPLLLLDGEITPEASSAQSPAPETAQTATPPKRKRVTIYNLAAECIVAVLEFMRSTDLCAVSEVDKTVFSQRRIKLAVAYQLNTVRTILHSLLHSARGVFTPFLTAHLLTRSHSSLFF